MWQNFKKDAVISERPCDLHQVVVTPTYKDSCNVTLYDGRNASGRLIATIRCAEHDTQSVIFNPSIPCSEGLYLDIGSDVDTVIVSWDHTDLEPTEWEGAVTE